MTIPAAFGKARFWRNTSVATLAAGATATLPAETLGYEWDFDVDNGVQPNRLLRLSQTTKTVSGKLTDWGSTFSTGTVTHTMTLYKADSGALVFGAGTVQWAWGLDANHDRGSSAADVRMKQATVNLFADMGVQPGTLQSGLVAGTPSTDTVAPTSTITSPLTGATVVSGNVVTITGTAADTGGGILMGVEVSTDGGATWKAATGTSSWTFSWTVGGGTSATIKSRAFDDSLNVEAPSAGVTVNVNPSRTCPCSVWASTVVPPAPLDDGDSSSVELGMKLRTDSNGYITGVRFYKGSLNTGTHTGSLWTSTGGLLGTVTFTGETASGWQSATFPSAIPVTANTTYVVSYHAPVGHYTGTDPFFASAGVDNPPLHALRDGVDGPNGLYVYGSATAFPNNTFDTENYWVDVVFTTTPPVDTTPPTVASTVPTNNATNISPSTLITATFSEAMDASTITSSTAGSEGGGATLGTVELRDPGNNLVNATLTYDAGTRTATLTPKTALALSTKYTALIKGGTTDPRVKDLAGNALAANVLWSFTVAATPNPPPPAQTYSIWPSSTVPSSLDDGDPSSVELGTKFRSDVAGYITGARFYKGSANTGTHTASLWTGAGTLLATATYSGETASGWQQVSFATPVQIVANTTYVVSYHAPNGHYSAPDNYFATTGVDNAPLHALKNGVDGGNGVYIYASSTAFPNQSFASECYFADVVFTTSLGNDTTPPNVVSVTPLSGASGVRANSSANATFNEALDPATVTASTLTLRDPSNTLIPATVTYDAPMFTVRVTPNATLQYSTRYTATVAAGVKDISGNATTTPYSWFFTTAAPPPPPPTQGPGGPVLVITTSGNLFTTYFAEILRGEGANEFATKDLSQVTAADLANYDVVILGEMPLSAAQVSMLTTWVNGGGNLIAMRPDRQLAGLAGLTDATATLADAYLLINTAAAPGAGIVNQTMQFHGTADRYTLNGATALATLYSNATTATSNPAVATRTVGAGHVVTFTFDLGRSIVYTRQGNPAWAGQDRDSTSPIRSDDLFFPDYVDFSKIAIPQADELQRFLWNIILNVNAAKKPLPRFWYLPRMLAAAVIMTGDDHGYNGTAGRFNDFIGASTLNCPVDDWGCIRGTSYVYPGTPITDAQVTSYVSQGFEIALHVNTNCADFTPASLPGFYNTQLAQFATSWPHAPTPVTNRTHCVAWSDWATQPQVEFNSGIRLDTTYYYWPDVWVLDRPGVFTGSGMPQRFATQTGQMIDVYQAATQMTDESAQTFPKNIDTLLNNAIGATGYYGVFTANMHTDFNPSNGETWAMSIVNSAKAHNVPVISAKQALDWLDGRNGSSFQSIAWNGNVLTFSTSIAAGTSGLRTLVPAVWGTSSISGILLDGAPVSYTTQTIKGIQYAIFASSAGTYQVSYGVDITPPTITSVAAAPSATTATVTWATNELADSVVSYGTGPAALTQTASSAALVLAHSIPLSGLAPNTTYFMRVSSTDGAGNGATSPSVGTSPLAFTTAALSISGTLSPSQFGGGASLNLAGPLSTITAADASGNFTFTGLPSGSYTVTPSKTGYSFTPPSQSVTLTNANATSVNFSTQAVTISGTVSPTTNGAGTTLTMAGPMAGTATADGSGIYSFTGLADGVYTVTPAKTGFTFTPTSQSVTITGGVSATGVNFTVQPIPTWTISGTVTGGSSATVALSGSATKSTTADASGNYSFTGLSNGNYTVAPTKAGFTMTPASQAVTVNGADVASINFAAQPIPTYTISGTVAGGGGAAVALTGTATRNVTADGSGNYSFTGLLNGTYTITPTKAGFTMAPASQTVTVNTGDIAAVNFTAQPIPTFTISGTISPALIGAGATVGLTGGGTTTADPSGNYTFTGVLNGTYTVTPTKTGVTMTPATRSVTIAGASMGSINFTATVSANPVIDATVTLGRSTRATTIASPAFSTTAGSELVLAFVATDNLSSTTTVTGVAGGGLTWALVRRTNTQRGTAEIWRAFAPAVLTSVTATATLSQSVAASITVMTFKGVDSSGTNGSGAIGATGTGNNGAGAPTASLTTTRANSLIVGVGNDWDNAIARTPGANQVVVSQYLATVGDTFWVQRVTTTTIAAGTVVTVNDTAPTGDQFNLTICEVLGGS